jgi:hypothetical protein
LGFREWYSFQKSEVKIEPGNMVMIPNSNSEWEWKEEASKTRDDAADPGKDGRIPMEVFPDQRSPWIREGFGP